MKEDIREIKIAVRNLVEFIMCSGDLDNTKARSDADAMQAGSKMHRKLQKQMGANYTAEVPLSITVPVTRDGIAFELTVEGRADGIINNNTIKEDFSVLIFEEEEANPPEIVVD